MKKALFILFLIFNCITIKVFTQVYQPTWESIDKRPTPTWFEDAKFGIFIHWGLYSVPSYSPTARDSVPVYSRYAEHFWRRWVEQSDIQGYFTSFLTNNYGVNFRYQDFAPMFKAEMFEPDDWANLFKKAGAKYVVLTSKHHEGFTLWPSKYASNWNSVDVGPHRDLVGDLTKSVKANDIKMGYYYSLLEWYNPLYNNDKIDDYVVNHMIPQMKELVATYKPDMLWTDGEWDYSSAKLKSTTFLQWLYNDSPVKESIVVNDRWGKETRSKHGGFYTTEYDLINEDDSKHVKFEHPWEECRGIGGSFGYNRRERLEEYSSSKELIDILIDKVARGGNLLLNVGPTADGRIPVIMQQRLVDIGQWLKTNGEAIYETRAWNNAPNVKPETTQFFTKKGNCLYLIVTKWTNEPLQVKKIRNAKKVTILGYNGNVKFKINNNNLIITPPVITPDVNPSQYAWVYKIENADL